MPIHAVSRRNVSTYPAPPKPHAIVNALFGPIRDNEKKFQSVLNAAVQEQGVGEEKGKLVLPWTSVSLLNSD